MIPGHSLRNLRTNKYLSHEAFGFFCFFSSITSVLQCDSVDRYTASCSSRVHRTGEKLKSEKEEQGYLGSLVDIKGAEEPRCILE